MTARTTISWTDRTWNPGRGCRRKSRGCNGCYAERQANRFRGKGQAYEGLIQLVGGKPRWSGAVKFLPETLAEPMHWHKTYRIFVDSMSDLFYEEFTNEQIAAVFGVMAVCGWHSFQILTKRPDRMRQWFEWVSSQTLGGEAMRPAAVCIMHAIAVFKDAGLDDEVNALTVLRHLATPIAWPLPNVWLGTSVEDQDSADDRIPELLETPAAIRFLSCEPLIGRVDISEYFDPCSVPCGEEPWPMLDWVIVGCESGPGARPCDIAWLRSLRDQCVGAHVRFFLKQAVKLRGGDDESGDAHRIERGRGSREKGRGHGGKVIELPYLDGEQWAQFPEEKAAA